MKPVVLVLSTLVALGMSLQSASAHSEFKKALQDKYDYKTVSCNTCHVARKPKTERNELGMAFSKEFESIKFDGKGITEKHKEIKDVGTQAEIDAFEEEMKSTFLKVLEEVKKKAPKDSDKTWGELFDSAKSEEDVVDGIKPKK